MTVPAATETARPKWLRLLEHSDKRRSLPFVIGALRESGAIPADEDDFERVYQPFQNMASAALSFRWRTLEAASIGELLERGVLRLFLVAAARAVSTSPGQRTSA